MAKIIGFTGFISCGKNTAADYLVSKHGFTRDSFAGSLKDAVAQIFGWDRDLLEGLTPEAREWRETVDQWWAKRLNISHLTPRWVLQQWGTEVCRGGFHDDIWIASLENRLRSTKNDIVISDVRFPNEIKAIRNAGGVVVWVQRGELPSWYECAMVENTTPSDRLWLLEDSHQLMSQQHPNIHRSEWAWIGTTFNHIIDNNKNVDHLYSQIKNLLLDQ